MQPSFSLLFSLKYTEITTVLGKINYRLNEMIAAQRLFLFEWKKERKQTLLKLSFTEGIYIWDYSWLLGFTILVFDVGAGSTPEQLQGTLLLASIGCTVQWSVTQQIRAVDVWRLRPAELQWTCRIKTDGLCRQCPAGLSYSAKNCS